MKTMAAGFGMCSSEMAAPSMPRRLNEGGRSPIRGGLSSLLIISWMDPSIALGRLLYGGAERQGRETRQRLRSSTSSEVSPYNGGVVTPSMPR